MAAAVKWVGNHIEVAPPKKPKKITGTRFATILGLNPWSTPFEVWCAVSRTYEKKFEDTIYTRMGKYTEPKQALYMMESYGMTNLKTPTDIFGEDYFKNTRGDFFHEYDILGGMWDYLLYEDGKPTTVLEMKTTKRAEDWADHVPEYYALQAALYAYLLGVDDVIMVASFLETSDYDHPEDFVPSATNTQTFTFKVSEKYPNFGQMVAQVNAWWEQYVETGISPDFDPKKDKEILDALKINTVSPDTEIEALLAEADEITAKIGAVTDLIAKDEARLKAIKDAIRDYSISQFRDGDNKVSLESKNNNWTISKSTSLRIDEDALAADGLLEKYKTKSVITYRVSAKSK